MTLLLANAPMMGSATPAMMLRLALPIVFLLAGCSNPGLHTGIHIGPNGVRVTPVATAQVGGATVSISP